MSITENTLKVKKKERMQNQNSLFNNVLIYVIFCNNSVMLCSLLCRVQCMRGWVKRNNKYGTYETWGVTNRSVLGLDVFLPDGLQSFHQSRKPCLSPIFHGIATPGSRGQGVK